MSNFENEGHADMHVSYYAFKVTTTGIINKMPSYTDLREYEKCRLVSIALIAYKDDNEEIPEFSLHELVRPDGFDIPNTEFHGISTEKALQEGITIEALYQRVDDLLQRSILLVGHCIHSFDILVLKSEFFRKGLNLQILDGVRHQCTFNEARSCFRLCDYKLPSNIYSTSL